MYHRLIASIFPAFTAKTCTSLKKRFFEESDNRQNFLMFLSNRQNLSKFARYGAKHAINI